MPYTPSIRELPLDEEPMASAIAAVLPDEDESPGSTEMRWDNATEEQLKLLRLHPEAKYIVGDVDLAEQANVVGPEGEES